MTTHTMIWLGIMATQYFIGTRRHLMALVVATWNVTLWLLTAVVVFG